MQERYLQKAIVALAIRLGYSADKIESRSRVGFPDLAIIGHGLVVFAEVKTPTGRLSEMQKATIEDMKNHGALVEVWRSVADAEEFLTRAAGGDNGSV